MKMIIRFLHKRILIVSCFLGCVGAFAADNIPDGEQKVFDASGHMLQSVFFKDGKKHGLAKEFFPNGALRYQYNYHNDMLEGESCQYFENGQLQVKVSYHHNLKEGVYEEYYSNGKKLAEYYFVKGLWAGVAKEYAAQGFLVREMHFVEGKLYGEVRDYQRKDVLRYRLNFVQGLQQGVGEIFDEKGVHIANRFFVEGKPLFEERLVEPKPRYELLVKSEEANLTLESYKDIQKEIAAWDGVLAKEPEREEGYFQRGLLKLKLGCVTDAIKDFSISVKKDPTFGVAWAARACANALLKNSVEAEEDFAQAQRNGYNTAEWRRKKSLKDVSDLF